jgi:hypothetical protein
MSERPSSDVVAKENFAYARWSVPTSVVEKLLNEIYMFNVQGEVCKRGGGV